MGKIKKGLLRGSKISNKHSSVTPATIALIEAAKALPNVSKIVLSEITRLTSGEHRIRFNVIPAGLRVVVRGSASQQILFVYTSNPKATEEALQQTWNEERR